MAEIKKEWWKETVIYQIYPRSFKDSNGDGIGDLRGIIEKADYLKELGVGMVWLCPVYASPNDDNGYDVSDYYQIHPEFGTMEDMDELAEELGKRGIKIMMDLVFNHTSDQHMWFQESKKSKDNPYRNFYVWKDGKEGGLPPNNWRGYFNEPAWEYDETTDQYYLRLYTKKMPDLNWECQEMREEVYKIINYWVDKGVAGFRMDTINTIGKDQNFPDAPDDAADYVKGRPFFTNQPTMHDVLREMNERIFTPRSIVTVGECSASDIEETLLMVAEDQHKLSMNHQFEHDELDFGPDGAWDIVPFTAAQVYDVIERWMTQLPAGGGWNSWFWGNHDLPRPVSRFGNDSPEFRERSAKLLAALEFTMLCTPFVYQGEEIGMINAYFDSMDHYRDVDAFNYYKYAVDEAGISVEDALENLKYRSRDNARTPMQWTSGDNAGFTTGTPWIEVIDNKDEINVEDQLKDPDSVFNFYKAAIALRKDSPAILYGDFVRVDCGTEEAMVYERNLDGEKVMVAVNMTDNEVALSKNVCFGELKPVLNNVPENTNPYVLKAWQAVVYK